MTLLNQQQNNNKAEDKATINNLNQMLNVESLNQRLKKSKG